jgi:hypothetical protein
MQQDRFGLEGRTDFVERLLFNRPPCKIRSVLQMPVQGDTEIRVLVNKLPVEIRKSQEGPDVSL